MNKELLEIERVLNKHLVPRNWIKPTLSSRVDWLCRYNASLRHQLGEKILLRARDSLVIQRERYYPYSADVMAYLYEGIEFLTEHLLVNFKR